MTDVPPADRTPKAVPLEEPIVATPALALVHVPPPPSLNPVVPPGHTCSVPDMADGAGFTVIVFVTEQPVKGKE